MSNLEAPKFRKITAGDYVADMTNHAGHGLRATLDKVTDPSLAALGCNWQMFVYDRQPGQPAPGIGLRENDTLTVVSNTFHSTMVSAKAFLNAKLANGDIRAEFAA